MTGPTPTAAPAPKKSKRIAAIDWMRGFVMILMVIDHASMAFNGDHNGHDSAMYALPGTAGLPDFAFLTRVATHLCAPTFVFLAGTALALSIERKVAKGADGKEIDRAILIRGAIIALLDPTVISLGSGRMTLQVLLAIGVAMMCMAPLRKLSTPALLTIGIGWFAVSDFVTGFFWAPPGGSSIPAALTIATYAEPSMVIKYPVVPWLGMMVLGWVFGRWLVSYTPERSRLSPRAMLFLTGSLALGVFAAVRYFNGYGNMFLLRTDDSWQQYLFVSKYPPSLSFAAMQLGLLGVLLAGMITVERWIGVRNKGPLLVFGQTSMFFYLVHRLVLEIPATWFGLRGASDLTGTYIISIVLMIALYPLCLWYRGFKAQHPQSFLKYF